MCGSTRGLGRFWGFQEAWLSLVGSIFDMAVYPTLFVAYLGHFAPSATAGGRGAVHRRGADCRVRGLEPGGSQDRRQQFRGHRPGAARSVFRV